MTYQESLDKLKEGNAYYIENKFNSASIGSGTRNALLEGQSPTAIILSCADSRVVPEHIFNTGLGELFIIRVAGNVANTSSLASMEYAVAHLGTPLIVVLGHQYCGAVTAAVNGGDYGPNLNHLLDFVKPAIEQSPDPSSVYEVTIKNTELTANSITERSEIIRNAVKEEKLKIITAYYNLDSGKVDF